MAKYFKIAGILLITTGVIFLIIQMLSLQSSFTSVGLPGSVKGFSDIRIPDEKEVREVFSKAEGAMNENVSAYKNWNNVSVFASWAAFFLSGIITLLAGYLGFYGTENVNMESLQASIKGKEKLSKIVGLMAAAATLMTGFSVKAKEEAEARRAKGVQIRDLIIASYKDIQLAKPDEVTVILQKLKLESSF